ncbi:hypothetical protein Bb109J_c1219 [Bdellovibrio bacteriovorus]|uniref:RCC1 domain-containing protein n=1 Tax=Bdellovibrio bacteriovorus TaxID=959 RepID=UPI00045C02DA|nr:hypothetical protein [Bdellovibrio bacteriovorus]AHZ86554.1 hypothetical protein EP01_16660 [Bdellovibrio bacteriovorus]BEV67799.1 hypothetical protein Bb109J_c1219 [Bdellovibrio bacteriovorus]
MKNEKYTKSYKGSRVLLLKIFALLLSSCSLDITISKMELTSISSSSPSYKLSSGPGYHLCLIDPHSELWCLGSNSQFELGLGESTTQPGQPTVDRTYTPVKVDTNEKYQSVSVAEAGTCAITTTNQLKCWGSNNGGRLGFGSDGANNPVAYLIPAPTIVDADEKYIDISLGNTHACAITTQNKLKCWGQNYSSQLGLGGDDVNGPSIAAAFLPTAVDGIEKYKSVSVGSDYTCAITLAGQLKCWGANGNGQLGLGGDLGNGPSSVVSYVPTVVNSGKKYSTVAASNGSMRSTCAVDELGTLECFGDNFGGKLGVGHSDTIYVPTSVLGSNKYKTVSVGNLHTCATTTSNLVQCWGYSYNGNLGISENIDDSVGIQYESPMNLLGGESYDSVSVGTYSSWGITSSGELRFWGMHDITLDNNTALVPTLYHSLSTGP